MRLSNAALYAKQLKYDPNRDVEPIIALAVSNNVLVVHPSVPVKTVPDLVALAKSQPGQLTFVSAGVGTSVHMAGEMFKHMAGVNMVHVTYKSRVKALVDLIAGRVDVMFDNLSAAKPHIQGGRLKALAVSSAQRSAALPMVPTVNETGLTRFEGESWFGVFAPVNTPSQVVNRLRETLALINRENEFVSRVHADGGRMLNVPAGQQQSFLRDEIERSLNRLVYSAPRQAATTPATSKSKWWNRLFR